MTDKDNRTYKLHLLANEQTMNMLNTLRAVYQWSYGDVLEVAVDRLHTDLLEQYENPPLPKPIK